jgi:hypothetical protein
LESKTSSTSEMPAWWHSRWEFPHWALIEGHQPMSSEQQLEAALWRIHIERKLGEDSEDNIEKKLSEEDNIENKSSEGDINVEELPQKGEVVADFQRTKAVNEVEEEEGAQEAQSDSQQGPARDHGGEMIIERKMADESENVETEAADESEKAKNLAQKSPVEKSPLEDRQVSDDELFCEPVSDKVGQSAADAASGRPEAASRKAYTNEPADPQVILTGPRTGVKKQIDENGVKKQGRKPFLVKNAETGRLICQKCGEDFSASAYHYHKRICDGKTTRTCEKCGRAFLHRGNLATHVKSCKGLASFELAGSRRVICPKCGQDFKEGSNFWVHEKKCNGRTTLKCEKCGRVFLNRGGLTTHVKTCKAKVNTGDLTERGAGIANSCGDDVDGKGSSSSSSSSDGITGNGSSSSSSSSDGITGNGSSGSSSSRASGGGSSSSSSGGGRHRRVTALPNGSEDHLQDAGQTSTTDSGSCIINALSGNKVSENKLSENKVSANEEALKTGVKKGGAKPHAKNLKRNAEGLAVCEACEMTFLIPGSLYRHRKTCKGKKSDGKCEKCGKCYLYPDGVTIKYKLLRRHEKLHCKGKATEPAEKKPTGRPPKRPRKIPGPVAPSAETQLPAAGSGLAPGATESDTRSHSDGFTDCETGNADGEENVSSGVGAEVEEGAASDEVAKEKGSEVRMILLLSSLKNRIIG